MPWVALARLTPFGILRRIATALMPPLKVTHSQKTNGMRLCSRESTSTRSGAIAAMRSSYVIGKAVITEDEDWNF